MIRKRYALLALAFPCAYIAAYLMLRVAGVYYLFWNQGSWDSIDGTTGIAVVDRAFIPAAEFELRLQNSFPLTAPPAGG